MDSFQHEVHIDESNTFLVQKLLYYFHINNIYKNFSVGVNDTSTTNNANNTIGGIFHLNGVMDVRGEKVIFLMPTYNFIFNYKDTHISFKYEKYQLSKVDRGTIIKMAKIILCCTDLSVISCFLYEIEKLEFNVPENKLIKYIWQNSYWKYCNGFKRRDIDTIYLPSIKKNNVISEINYFINEEHEFYERLSIPERKVFLFWGIPGSGKTTFIKSIASHYNKNIAIVKNTIDIDDNSLETMINDLPKNCIILFEDIDSLFQGRTNVANTRVTFSGLLNFLDGILEYNKLLVFITTNNLKHIDDALKRRIDIFMEFTFIKKQEARRMFNKFFEDKYQFDIFFKLIKHEISANTLEKYFIKCLVTDLSPITNIELLYSYIETIKNEQNTLYQ